MTHSYIAMMTSVVRNVSEPPFGVEFRSKKLVERPEGYAISLYSYQTGNCRYESSPADSKFMQ